jgi:predicted ester cyclase
MDVALEWKLDGRFQGKLMGLDGDGRGFHLEGISFVRLRKDEVARARTLVDRAELMRQLGFVWAPPSTASNH